MELINETTAVAEWTVGFQKDGREFVCLVAKMTYELPPDGEEATLAVEKLPVTQADVFTGEPGLSAVALESDFAHEKSQCDVLLNGSAYAPGGRSCESVCVGLHVGPISKRLEVTGDRFWDHGVLGMSPTRPLTFTQKAISYDVAYGGTSHHENRPEKIHTYLENPVGRGYYPLEATSELIGRPLANTQEVGKPATLREADYRPMAYGPMGRNFKQRAAYVGTYDQGWMEKQAPFFPDDFDYRYFQAAPLDQRMPYPQAPLDFTLENLTPEGIRRFRLPVLQIPVLVFEHNSDDPQQYDFNLDTILIEPDFNRIGLVWRLKIPLRKSIFDIGEVVLGQSFMEYHRSVIRSQKPHYKNLNELIQANRARDAK